MNMGGSFWLKRFALSALISGLTIVFMVIANEVLLLPLLRWIFLNRWRWSAPREWLQFVVLGAIVGVIAGAFFTTHAWLTETRSSMLRRIITTVAVVTTCIAIVVFAREYLGRVLPG
ncbi:hypothetical protein J2W36_000110 [Variovorax ginsengisoli]|uniref:Uncharacterized protein n=1 Tax=Variovorax ginsengisoli TaxID=363844 RepID=A0ABT9S3D8_9BURK|nr:hypothetical protein [Variovorax ginsengisoli]